MTPEEKTRIYEEEKARKDTQNKLKAEQAASGMKGCLSIFAVLAVALFAFFYFTGDTEPPAANAEDAFIKPGATVKLAVDGNAVPVATESQFYERMIDRLNVGDTKTLGRMMVAGQMFSVKNGTQALVISPGIFSTEVRILDGDHKGDHGLVKTSWIAKP